MGMDMEWDEGGTSHEMWRAAFRGLSHTQLFFRPVLILLGGTYIRDVHILYAGNDFQNQTHESSVFSAGCSLLKRGFIKSSHRAPFSVVSVS